ncbi:MAG: hypothetical protein ABIO70_36065 [Pseudomonadota bacterium]
MRRALRATSLSAPLLLGAPAAHAHSPHDIAAWVAVSPGAEPEWIITSLIRFDAWIVARTQDGRAIETRYIMPDSEQIGTAALLGPERLLLGTDGLGLWVSEDAGDTFQVHADLPADATIRKIALSPDFFDDQTALAVGFVPEEDGTPLGQIWRTTDAGRRWALVRALYGLALTDLKLSPDFSADGRAFALTADGQVVRGRDGGLSWGSVRAVPDTCWQVAVGAGQRAWVATDSRGLWRSDDDGVTFTPAAFEGRRITTVIELDGGLVLATLPDEGVWRSEDGGQTWSYQHDLIQPAQSGVGNPTDGNHYYDFFEDDRGTIWLASWEGITRSTDRGLTWRAVETYRPDALHGVSITLRAETGAPTAVIGSNGGGIEWVDPAAREAQPVGLTMPRPWPRVVRAGPAWSEQATILTTLSCGLAGTFDTGQTWASLAAGALDGAEDVDLPLDFATLPHVLAVGMVDGRPGWAFSTDGGHSFRVGSQQLGAQATPCTVAAFSSDYAQDGLAWIACGGTGVVYVTADEGDSWDIVGATGAIMEAMAPAPGGEPLFLATMDGLYSSRGGGAPTPLAFLDEPVWDVVISPDWAHDPAVFALTARSGWFRSDDGGVTWISLPRPTEGVAQHLAISPDFAEDGAVAATSFEGAWMSYDRGEHWQDAHAVEVVDIHHPYWTLSEDWENLVDDDAVSHAYVRAQAAGATATGTFKGVGLALLGRSAATEPGRLAVRLDGEEVGTVDLGAPPEGAHPALWSAWDLTDDWHTVELKVLEGQACFSAMEVLRQPFALLDLAPPSGGGDTGEGEDEQGGCEGRCQAGAGGGAWAWLLGLVLTFRRRR